MENNISVQEPKFDTFKEEETSDKIIQKGENKNITEDGFSFGSSVLKKIFAGFNMKQETTQNSSAVKASESNQDQTDWHYKRFTPDDLPNICNTIEHILNYIRNIQEVIYITYDYPCSLQNDLEKQANEVYCFLLELRAAKANIERLKLQRKAVKKEKLTMKKLLKRMRDDEIREMESIVSIYDKTMYSRWESIKNTQKPATLENFISDIMGKQQAMENLNILANRRLNMIQPFRNLISKEVVELPDKNTQNNYSEEFKFGTYSSTKRTLGPINPTRSNRRRRNAERIDICSNSNNGPQQIMHRDYSSVDLPLVPFVANNNNYSNPPPFFQIFQGNSSSNSSIVATASSSTAANAVPADSESSVSSNTAEFQNDMRMVLQALFSELRGPTTNQNSENQTNCNENPEQAEANNSDVDFFTPD